MSYTVQFANCSDPRNKVSKTFTPVEQRTATLVEPCDVISPTIIVSGSYINANSVEGLFSRNYFITSQTLSHGRNYVSLRCDPLSSFSGSVIGSNQFVVRSATDYDLAIPDPCIPTAIQPIPQVTQSSDSFGSTTESFILGVTEYDFKPNFIKMLEGEPTT